MNHLVPGETVVLMKPVAMKPDTKEIHCVNILNTSNSYIEYIYIGDKYRSGKADIRIGISKKDPVILEYKFYKKNPRKVFDNMVNKITSDPLDKKLNPIESILVIPGIPGGPSSLNNPDNPYKKSGGRRKHTGTRRRPRKNKRKSTRRIRRKYKR